MGESYTYIMSTNYFLLKLIFYKDRKYVYIKIKIKLHI